MSTSRDQAQTSPHDIDTLLNPKPSSMMSLSEETTTGESPPPPPVGKRRRDEVETEVEAEAEAEIEAGAEGGPVEVDDIDQQGTSASVSKRSKPNDDSAGSKGGETPVVPGSSSQASSSRLDSFQAHTAVPVAGASTSVEAGIGGSMGGEGSVGEGGNPKPLKDYHAEYLQLLEKNRGQHPIPHHEPHPGPPHELSQHQASHQQASQLAQQGELNRSGELGESRAEGNRAEGSRTAGNRRGNSVGYQQQMALIEQNLKRRADSRAGHLVDYQQQMELLIEQNRIRREKAENAEREQEKRAVEEGSGGQGSNLWGNVRDDNGENNDNSARAGTEADEGVVTTSLGESSSGSGAYGSADGMGERERRAVEEGNSRQGGGSESQEDEGSRSREDDTGGAGGAAGSMGGRNMPGGSMPGGSAAGGSRTLKDYQTAYMQHLQEQRQQEL